MSSIDCVADKARQPFTSILDALFGHTTCAVGRIPVLREELAAAMCCGWVGGRCMCPALDRERIAHEVRAKFNGRNTRTLVRECGVNARWIQRLLQEIASA